MMTMPLFDISWYLRNIPEDFIKTLIESFSNKINKVRTEMDDTFVEENEVE